MKHYLISPSGYVHSGCDRVACKPVVVIDAEDREQVERLLSLYADAKDRQGAGMYPDYTADAMQAALREFANPTPPKPDEPTGLGAVVEDGDGYQWVRVSDPRGHRWYRDNAWAAEGEYADIAAVRVLSEGVTE